MSVTRVLVGRKRIIAEVPIKGFFILDGALPAPIYRFHTKTLYKSMAYRVTVRLVAGSVPKTIPYAFIVEVLRSV